MDFDSKYIFDEQGRVLILHGTNTADAKETVDGMPGPMGADDYIDRHIYNYGMNVVRLLAFWMRIEPEKGVFDDVYLTNLEKTVKRYTDKGMYVLIDFHQDLYSPSLSSSPIPNDNDGAPAWATYTDGLVPKKQPLSKIDWSLQHLDPATMAAFRNFFDYKKYPELQDHLIGAQVEVVRRLKDNPRVIGYDLFNEPFSGDICNTLDGSFQANQLSDFYQRAIDRIRGVDDKKYIFLEPQAVGPNQGLPGGLRPLKDPIQSAPRLVYAPHIYPLGVTAGMPYTLIDTVQIAAWADNRIKEMKALNMPMVVGEIGATETVNINEYFDAAIGKFDELNSGFILWTNEEAGWSIEDQSGHICTKAASIVRPYPRTISGKPVKFSFNRGAGKLELTFKQDKDVTAPTEIFIPELQYPNGWTLDIKGQSQRNCRWSFDGATQILSVYMDYSESEKTIRIMKK
ncbi:cellulase family glycosylhydrolase [Leminorella grimontii]|uniref:cellulase family glycosylhydrolase n=1 Tax=Leminorella grimontii TaxID=82981 RepID=UPI00321F875F